MVFNFQLTNKNFSINLSINNTFNRKKIYKQFKLFSFYKLYLTNFLNFYEFLYKNLNYKFDNLDFFFRFLLKKT